MITPRITYRVPSGDISNGGFENGDTGWQKEAGWVIGQGQALTGSWQATFISTGSPTTGVLTIRSETSFIANPGDVITASAYVTMNTNQPSGSFCCIRLLFFDVNLNVINYALGTQLTQANGWQLSTISYATPLGAVSFTVDVAVTSGFVGGADLDNVTVSGGFDNVSFDFLYPPTGKPAYEGNAQRTDVLSTSGVRQTTLLRVDTTVTITMNNILDDGSDLPAWQQFVDWATRGGSFVYIPDNTNLDNFIQCFMTETSGLLKYASPGVYSFSGTFQKEVSA